MTLVTILERIMALLPGKDRKYRGLRGVGQEWENLAEKVLREAGYRIRARNFRAKVGEIDVVAIFDGGADPSVTILRDAFAGPPRPRPRR
jgi:hypothetical protein